MPKGKKQKEKKMEQKLSKKSECPSSPLNWVITIYLTSHANPLFMGISTI